MVGYTDGKDFSRTISSEGVKGFCINFTVKGYQLPRHKAVQLLPLSFIDCLARDSVSCAVLTLAANNPEASSGF